MSTTPLTLSFAGQQPPIALPQVPGTRGPVGVDMRGLNQSGFCSYDPGFANTAGCQSAISWIDTENSVLLHRGYPVDQLARQCDFLEVAYIMLNGDAPDEASYQTFRETITRHTLVHEQIARMCSGFRRDSHPMALMCALVGALAAFYHDVLDVENPQHRALAATRLLSKMPTIAAMSYKYTIEQPAAYPRNDLSYAGNFLQMLFAIPAEKYVLNPVIEQAMNQILVLHADHGQCASTTTVRAAGSSGANLFACVAAGLASLWGRCMEEQMNRACECWRRLKASIRFRRFCARRSAIRRHFAGWVLATRATVTVTRAPISCVKPAIGCWRR
ncbi:Citrate synthase (si) [Klebsiella pneumoniae]|nr:Citrate synthase (si) [Klebsiella pneumoniae]